MQLLLLESEHKSNRMPEHHWPDLPQSELLRQALLKVGVLQ